MWTHLHPYLRKSLTGSYIAKDARVMMYRALNLRRLIALTGSGATNAFGFPHWEDLALLFVRATQQQIDACRERTPLPMSESAGERQVRLDLLATEIGPLTAQVARLCGGGRSAVDPLRITVDRAALSRLDDTTLVMDLCERILEALPDDFESGRTRLMQAREKFAQRFRQPEIVLTRLRIEEIDRQHAPKGEQAPAPTRSKIADDLAAKLKATAPDRGLLLAALSEIVDGKPTRVVLEALQSLEENKKKGFGPKIVDPPADPARPDLRPLGRDIVATLARDLRVSRIATLNYDVQAEREVLERITAPVEDNSDSFVDLCKDYRTPRDATRKLVVESGLRKGAATITLGPANIGDIVNFAAFSRRYEWQILHLHGRFDDPENMVVTKSDYLRVYMQPGVSREIFREAQEAMFGGNDVLLVGMGMREEDVLRPFRRFVAREDTEPVESRRVFLLRAAHSCSGCRPGEVCPACARRDEEVALRHYVNYRVYTLYFGGPKFRVLHARLDQMIDIVAKGRGRTKADAEVMKTHVKELNAALDAPPVLLPEGEIALLRPRGSAGQEDAFFRRIAADPARKTAYVETLNEIRGRVTSRALCAELRSLKADTRVWWDAWRQPPHERRALYRMASLAIAGRENYLWIRHCPALVSTPRAPGDFEPLQDARGEALRAIRMQERRIARSASRPQQKVFEDAVAASYRAKPPLRRVLRLSVPRGGGKGSLIRLLTRHESQQYLFAPAAGGEDWSHRAAFVAHLSFSIEFSSVARALTRFFARQTVKLQLDEDGTPEQLSALRKTGLELRDVLGHALAEKAQGRPYRRFFGRLRHEFAEEERRAADTILDEIEAWDPSALPRRLDDAGAFPPQIEELARLLYISRREDEPRLLKFPAFARSDEIPIEPERPHRLEVLRDSMWAYEREARGREACRVFVCLSGLDRICDRNGDGRNPMHRALFRMLTGSTGAHDRDPDPPMDLVLVSGRPDVPIAFLSEELEPGETLVSENEKFYSRMSKTGRVLKRWKRIEPFSWDDRKHLIAAANPDPHTAAASKLFFDWARASGSAFRSDQVTERHSTRTIHRALWRSVSLTSAVYAAWIERARTVPPEMLEAHFRDFVVDLDGAASRDAEPGVVGQVMAVYRSIDRPRSARQAEPGGALDGIAADPLDRDIVDLVLRHLVFFALPVEPWVLMDCPRVYQRLLQLFEEDNAGRPDAGDPGVAAKARRFLAERAWMLRYLTAVLERLARRSLVIGILSSSERVGEGADLDDRVHRRFALHARLREYLAYQMNLQVSDDGDLNHHQISIYCNQPLDLPTPSEEHFKLVRELVDHQIDRCRDTLEAVYRHSMAGLLYERQKWDPLESGESAHRDNDEVPQRAAMHVFGLEEPSVNTAGPAGAFGEIHAVSQRLRACFSVVRSMFSVGSLSRLDSLDAFDGEAPFEIYRGWIRGLLNAATGLERNRKEIELLLSGCVFPERPVTPPKAPSVPDLLQFDATGALAQGTIDALEQRLAPLGLTLRAEVPRLGKQSTIAHGDRAKYIVRIAERMEQVCRAAVEGGLTLRQSTSLTRMRHPYYRDEIAWLYNERGLASLIQGRIYDAIPLFNQALFLMRHKQAPDFDRKAFHAAERRINLNLSIASIERGRVAMSRAMLEDLARSLEHVGGSTPSKVRSYAKAYIALCDHLGGSFERAAKGYEDALGVFVEARELRAISIFSRHYGDLLARRKAFDEARERLRLAENAAAQAEQRDVQNLAIVSQATLCVTMGESKLAQGYIARAGSYARRMGLYRLQADALLADCQLKLSRGEYGAAAEAASQTIALSSRNGLRLRKLAALVSYGRIQILRGRSELAISILKEAKTECENLGYQVQAASAADLLAELNLEGAADGAHPPPGSA